MDDDVMSATAIDRTTDGPWEAATKALGGGPLEYCVVLRHFPGNVIPADVDHSTICIAEGIKNPADARLIAAAPDLLEAAEEALARLEKGAPGWGVAKDWLRAAIHKARGG